jgi:hypothetical protein
VKPGWFGKVPSGDNYDVRESHAVFTGDRARGYADRIKSSGFRFFWCDPIVELDENGTEVVLHRQVTWN